MNFIASEWETEIQKDHLSLLARGLPMATPMPAPMSVPLNSTTLSDFVAYLRKAHVTGSDMLVEAASQRVKLIAERDRTITSALDSKAAVEEYKTTMEKAKEAVRNRTSNMVDLLRRKEEMELEIERECELRVQEQTSLDCASAAFEAATDRAKDAADRKILVDKIVGACVSIEDGVGKMMSDFDAHI